MYYYILLTRKTGGEMYRKTLGIHKGLNVITGIMIFFILGT